MNRLHIPLITACLALLVAGSAARAQTFEIQELPVLSEKDDANRVSVGFFINDRGHVLGSRTTQDANAPASPSHAFLWDGTRAIDFGAFGKSSSPLGLNDLDQAIGTDSDLAGFGFFWDGTSVVPLGFFPNALNNLGQVAGAMGDRAVLWSARNGTQELGLLPGAVTARAIDINERSHVAGMFRADDSYNHGFFWSEETGMVDLGRASDVAAMNDHDQIAGSTIGGFPFRATVSIFPDGTAGVLWEDLPTPRRSTGEPATAFLVDINNAGQVAGSSDLRPIFWDCDGEFILSSAVGFAAALNDSGHVIHQRSNFATGDLEAFFWIPREGTAVALPTLGGDRTEPFSINEFDQATGFSRGVDGPRAVVWQPTGPLPAASEEILALMQLLREMQVDGRVFDGDAVSLLAKLTAADNQLRAGNTAAAVGVLASAQNQVEQLVRNDFVSDETGAELLLAIELIIELLP